MQYFRKLLLTICLAGSMLAILPTVALANNYTNQGGTIVDSACGTANQRFKVHIYEHTSFEGNHAIICSAEPYLCNIKMPGAGYDLTCFTAWPTFNDDVSSMVIEDLPTGYCIAAFSNISYGGLTRIFHSEGAYASLPNFNDTMTSLRRYANWDHPNCDD